MDLLLRRPQLCLLIVGDVVYGFRVPLQRRTGVRILGVALHTHKI